MKTTTGASLVGLGVETSAGLARIDGVDFVPVTSELMDNVTMGFVIHERLKTLYPSGDISDLLEIDAKAGICNAILSDLLMTIVRRLRQEGAS